MRWVFYLILFGGVWAPFAFGKTYYEILGVAPNASHSQIQEKVDALSSNRGSEDLRLIPVINTLSNPIERWAYDYLLKRNALGSEQGIQAIETRAFELGFFRATSHKLQESLNEDAPEVLDVLAKLVQMREHKNLDIAEIEGLLLSIRDPQLVSKVHEKHLLASQADRVWESFLDDTSATVKPHESLKQYLNRMRALLEKSDFDYLQDTIYREALQKLLADCEKANSIRRLRTLLDSQKWGLTIEQVPEVSSPEQMSLLRKVKNRIRVIALDLVREPQEAADLRAVLSSPFLRSRSEDLDFGDSILRRSSARNLHALLAVHGMDEVRPFYGRFLWEGYIASQLRQQGNRPVTGDEHLEFLIEEQRRLNREYFGDDHRDPLVQEVRRLQRRGALQDADSLDELVFSRESTKLSMVVEPCLDVYKMLKYK